MEPIKLQLNSRPLSGKSNARRLRATGQIPAVAYGKTLASTQLAVSPKALLEVLRSEHGRNALLELDLDGDKKVLALLCDYQYHPVSRALLHADFLAITEDEQVNLDIPFEPVGRPKGVVLGGTLRQVFRTLPVRCLPKDIPVKLTVDVAELGLEEGLSVKDLSLPTGVSVRLPPEQTVVAVVGETKRGEEEAAAPGAPAEGAAPAGGDKGKPAAKS